jgi:arylsulfatase A-like enzyme
MNRCLSSLRILLSIHLFALFPVRLAMAADKPNIIIFLADDLGYADVGVNGCKDIPTPHIDSIAKNGVRFTDGYAAHPVCSPSRAALMSGIYPHRFGFEHNSGPERYAAPHFGMPREVPSLAEKLKASGYTTGMVGKWHIGFKEGLRPHERGFSFHYGFLSGARSYYSDSPRELDSIIRNGVPVTDETEYLTDAFARESVDFIQRSKDQPWFLYLAFNAVHSPLEATEKYESRFPDITDKKRKTYAGMLSALDDAVGRVMSKVREIDEEENTLVFFYSDNGGPTAETSSRNDPLRGFKAQMFEGGIRVPFVMQWKGKVTAGKTYREPVMGFDCHATALAAAGLLEEAKGWPPSNAKDETAEGSRPATDVALDGVNLIPFVTGESTGRPHEELFWRAGQNHAVRMGDWKLVHSPQQGGTMLFNLREDIGEQHDLAVSQPDKLGELQAAFVDWEQGTEPARWIRQDQSNAEPGGALKKEPSNRNPRRRAGLPRIEDAFKTADKNNDGKLSGDEYPQPEIFTAVDTDQDGFATLAEVRAYFQSRRVNQNPRP